MRLSAWLPGSSWRRSWPRGGPGPRCSSRLAASERQWRVAFEHSPIGGALLDAVGGILVANEALPRMVGWPLHQLTRLNVIDIVDCEGGLPWQSWWEGLFSATASTHTTERRLRTVDGQEVWARITGALVTSRSSPDRVMMQFEDITSRREAELELANRALHDGLTGAPNRFLTASVAGECARGSPWGPGRRPVLGRGSVQGRQ